MKKAVTMSHHMPVVRKAMLLYQTITYLVITNPDANGHPYAVMIEPGDTYIAIRTVSRMRWLIVLAGLTITIRSWYRGGIIVIDR